MRGGRDAGSWIQRAELQRSWDQGGGKSLAGERQRDPEGKGMVWG